MISKRVAFEPASPRMSLITLPSASTKMKIYRVMETLTNWNLDTALSEGWVIIASWIDPENMVRDEPEYISNISFRLAKEGVRMIVMADLFIPLFPGVIENIDADMPGSKVAVVPMQSNELWKLRMASMAGYGPCGALGPGVKRPMDTPRLMTVGLDRHLLELVCGHEDVTKSLGKWRLGRLRGSSFVVDGSGHHLGAGGAELKIMCGGMGSDRARLRRSDDERQGVLDRLVLSERPLCGFCPNNQLS
jgi:hypothetical protein